MNNAILFIYWLLRVQNFQASVLSGIRWAIQGHWTVLSELQLLALGQDKLQKQEKPLTTSFIKAILPMVKDK